MFESQHRSELSSHSDSKYAPSRREYSSANDTGSLDKVSEAHSPCKVLLSSS